MATCRLRGPLSAVMGPCVDSYYCRIIPVWPTCHSRWNARMGPKIGCQLDDTPDSQESESQSHRTTFGGATPLTKPVKTRGAARARGGGPARRSPRQRRWSGWRRAGTDGHVLVAGRQRAGAGRRGPTRSARAYAAGADPRGQRRPTRPAHVNPVRQTPAVLFPRRLFASFPPARTPADQDLLPRTSGARSAACHLLL